MASFDTHAVVTQLERAGMDPGQAEADDPLSRPSDPGTAALQGQLATRGDVREAGASARGIIWKPCAARRDLAQVDGRPSCSGSCSRSSRKPF